MDQKTLAYINLYAVLGSLSVLCEIDKTAKKLIEGKDLSIGFAVKNGPEGMLIFKDGKCSFAEGTENCSIKLPFSSCKKFNGLINGTVTPIPSRGFTKIGFLLHDFTKLTDILTKYLRPEKEALDDADFYVSSTILMFYLILEALSQIGNNDKVGISSAGYISDGKIKLSISGGPEGAIVAKNHRLTAVHGKVTDFTSYMEFSGITTARELFDGEINAVASVGLGKVRIGGMVSQVDNINRILDRVSLYLA